MFRVIPAIDILEGKCVRLTKGDYATSSIYGDSPVDMALQWQELGARRLHIVDLDGAKKGQPLNMAAIKAIAQKTKCQLQVGGGIRTLETIRDYIEAGVQYIILGSIIFQDNSLFKEAIRNFGDHIIAGVDLLNGKPRFSGWLESTEISGVEMVSQLKKMGLSTVICTDIAKDGLLAGPNLTLYKQLSARTHLSIIASGGITSLEDIKAVKQIPDITGCIIGKALYEHKIGLASALELEE